MLKTGSASEGSAHAVKLFLSYRRGETSGHAGRLYDALVSRPDVERVFQDVAAIGPGQDFATAIDDALGDCDVVLALIGPTWLTIAGASDAPRIEQPDDYVRLELRSALESDRPVVPVLVGGARLPTADELPEDLRGLERRQAVTLRDESWHRDVDGLVQLLRGPPPKPQRRAPRPVVLASAVVVALGLAALSLWLWPRDGAEQLLSATTGTATTQTQLGPDDKPACPLLDEGEWNPIELGDDTTATVYDDDRAEDEGGLVYHVTAAQWRQEGTDAWRVLLKLTLENNRHEVAGHETYNLENLIVGRRPWGEPDCYTAFHDGGADADDHLPPGTVADALAGFQVGCRPEDAMRLRVSGSEEVEILFTEAQTAEDCLANE